MRSPTGRYAVSDDFPADPPDEAHVTPSSTAGGGKDTDSVDNETDPVKAALAGAQRITRSSPGRARKRRRRAEAAGTEGERGGYSGAWPDATDPAPIGDIAAGLM